MAFSSQICIKNSHQKILLHNIYSTKFLCNAIALSDLMKIQKYLKIHVKREQSIVNQIFLQEKPLNTQSKYSYWWFLQVFTIKGLRIRTIGPRMDHSISDLYSIAYTLQAIQLMRLFSSIPARSVTAGHPKSMIYSILYRLYITLHSPSLRYVPYHLFT